MSAPLWVQGNIEYGFLWNLFICGSLAGSKHLIDEKTARDLMPPLLTPEVPLVSAPRRIWPQIETIGGTKYIWYPWTSPKFIFRGNTICRMLALQKEIGVGRGWEMKMNKAIWSRGFVCGTDSTASGLTGALWCGWHLYAHIYLAQPSKLKLSGAFSVLFTNSEEAVILVCGWWRQGRHFLMRFIPPLITQAADTLCSTSQLPHHSKF